MRLARGLALALGAIACGSSPPAERAPAAAAPAPAAQEETAAQRFAGCKARESVGQTGVQHFVECDGAAYQILTVTDPAAASDLSDEEIVGLAAQQSGREVERGTLAFAGKPHRFRRYHAGEAGAARQALAGLVTVHRDPGRLLILHCIDLGTSAVRLDDATCAASLTVLVREGVTKEMLAATDAAEGPARIDIAGTVIDLPTCRRAGPDNVKCENGQLSWRAAPTAAEVDALVESEVKRLRDTLTGQGGRIDGDAAPSCAFLGRPARCRRIDVYLGSQALGSLRVYYISAATPPGALFAACSYDPAKEPPERKDALPAPCSHVLALSP